jgi:ring-1,2-phenylacetyl-CoA epoxidase subunit PaaA
MVVGGAIVCHIVAVASKLEKCVYTQGLDSLGKDALHVASTDATTLEARFQSRVDADEKIEPKDWMPEAYRHTLIRQISQHAHS